MKLTQLSIKNLRGIEDLSVEFFGMTTFIGPNNTGKSTVLRALQILLDQEKPTVDDWRGAAVDQPIEITGHFGSITEAERDVPGIASLVHNNEIRLRAVAAIEDGKVERKYLAFAREEQIQGWSEGWVNLAANLKAMAAELQISGANWRQSANKERLRQHVRERHPELVAQGDPAWTDEGISIDAALKQGMPQVELVPAVRDAEDEEKLVQRKNIFSEILSKEILPEIEQTPEYGNIVARASELSQRMTRVGEGGLPITAQISQELSLGARSVIELDVLFRLDPPDVSAFIGRGARIKLNDGIETPVRLQGHGAQRALVYSLVRYIATRRSNRENFSRSKILLFEEPELYLHPHLLRVLRSSLSELARQEDWQVVVTSHSPVMIDVANEPRSLVIMRRTGAARRIERTQLATDPFADGDGVLSERAMLRAVLDFHPTVCEAFFAERAVLVEGDSEMALFAFARAAMIQLGSAEVIAKTTVISCGGKWTIIPIARLLLAFGISFKIVHDEDRKGLQDWQLLDKPAIHPFKANARIAAIAGAGRVKVISDTLEDILFDINDTRKGNDKPYAAWVRMKEILDAGELPAKHELADLFRFAFAA